MEICKYSKTMKMKDNLMTCIVCLSTVGYVFIRVFGDGTSSSAIAEIG